MQVESSQDKPPLQNEAKLIHAAQSGDLEALSTICHHYLPIVYRRVWFAVPSFDAEDVTQEVFIAVVRKLKTFKGKSKFSTWLYTITKRKIADYYRKNNKRDADFTLSSEETINVASIEATTAFDTLDGMITIRRGFSHLPNKYREILLLRLVEGFSFADVADELEISYEAAKSLFRRAMASLRQAIEND